jgi:hypothetical protein
VESSDEKIIELSKTKLVVVIAGASAFVALGFQMFLRTDESIRASHGPWLFREPVFVHGMGLAAMLFFGLCIPLALRKLFDRKPGLILNSSGITDNASFGSAGFVPWSDIVGAGIYGAQRQQMLVIKLRDPDKYINRGSALSRRLNKANEKMGGSPVAIPSIALKIDFPELLALFNEYHRKYGS